MIEIHQNLPFRSYLDDPGYGNSDLVTMRNRPASVVKYRRENRGGDTRATGIGKAVHCRILTPDLFAQDFYCKKPGEEFRTKEAKAGRDALLDAGKTILSAEQAEVTRQAVEAVRENYHANASLEEAIGREVSIFWTCEKSELRRKCRPDYWFPFRGAQMVVDIKVSIECSKPIDRILRSSAWNGYLHQLAGNRAGLRAAGYDVQWGGLLLVPNAPPFAEEIRMLVWSAENLDMLEDVNVATAKQVKECEDNGFWPHGSEGGWQLQQLPDNVFADDIYTEELEGAPSMGAGDGEPATGEM